MCAGNTNEGLSLELRAQGEILRGWGWEAGGRQTLQGCEKAVDSSG